MKFSRIKSLRGEPSNKSPPPGPVPKSPVPTLVSESPFPTPTPKAPECVLDFTSCTSVSPTSPNYTLAPRNRSPSSKGPAWEGCPNLGAGVPSGASPFYK